jgi:hypothetical protein
MTLFIRKSRLLEIRINSQVWNIAYDDRISTGLYDVIRLNIIPETSIHSIRSFLDTKNLYFCVSIDQKWMANVRHNISTDP